MSIAPTLQRHLTVENIQYDVIPHDPTMSSARTAEVCRISGDRLAKAIALRRNAGFMLAVLPASHHLHLSDWRDQLGDNVEKAEETEIDPLFQDCAHGLFGGFKRSSQHFEVGGCDEHWTATIGAVRTSLATIAGTTAGGGTG
jgi:Aminoacyl-tRNA editing domain